VRSTIWGDWIPEEDVTEVRAVDAHSDQVVVEEPRPTSTTPPARPSAEKSCVCGVGFVHQRGCDRCRRRVAARRRGRPRLRPRSRRTRCAVAAISSTARGLSGWPGNAPLFVGRDGERITRGTIQSRIRRVFRRAGSDAQPVRGALVHGLQLANSDVSVYTLMKLLGRESMATSQRYVAGAAHETRAAARNPLYAFVRDRRRASNTIDRDGHL
jgi:hypothetical protein